MKVEVELPEIEGYEYTGKMFPEKGDEYVSSVDTRRNAQICTWSGCGRTVSMYPVVRKKQLTYKDLKMGEWYRFTDEVQPYQKLFGTSLDRPVVRIKVSYEDVK